MIPSLREPYCIGPKFRGRMPVSEPQLILSREWDLELVRCAERADLKGYFEVIA